MAIPRGYLTCGILTVTEFETASLALREATLWATWATIFLGLVQIGIVYYGIREMEKMSDERAKEADKRDQADARRHTEAMQERAQEAGQARPGSRQARQSGRPQTHRGHDRTRGAHPPHLRPADRLARRPSAKRYRREGACPPGFLDGPVHGRAGRIRSEPVRGAVSVPDPGVRWSSVIALARPSRPACSGTCGSREISRRVRPPSTEWAGWTRIDDRGCPPRRRHRAAGSSGRRPGSPDRRGVN